MTGVLPNMSKPVTYSDAVRLLNDLIEIDRDAIHNLVETRSPCSEELAEHPTVQVAEDSSGCRVGFLGVLNGLFGVRSDGYGHIKAVYDEDGILERFESVA